MRDSRPIFAVQHGHTTSAKHALIILESSYRALGDVFSQKIEGAKQVDLKRSLMTSVYGAAFIGESTSFRCYCHGMSCSGSEVRSLRKHYLPHGVSA